MKQPFLTIGIPTWNRFLPLQENLLALIKEISTSFADEVEIFVSDNASTDQTESVCLSLCKEYYFIRYHRNPENYGANVNFQNVIQMARGEYVWLLGDDDLIVPGSIAKIIHDIRSNHFPDIIIGGAILDTTGERVHLRGINQTALLNYKDAFTNYSIVDMCGKISVLLFKKTTIDPILPIAWPIITRLNSPWPHLVWILLMIKEGKSLALSYGISFYLSKNWHNLLFDGARLSHILFIETLYLVEALKNHLDPEIYSILMRNTVKLQRGELIRCVIYATYRNNYFESLREGIRSLRKLPGLRNRLDFFTFYFLPILLPTFFRRSCCDLGYSLFPKWERYRRLIRNLRESKKLSMTAKERTFNKAGL